MRIKSALLLKFEAKPTALIPIELVEKFRDDRLSILIDYSKAKEAKNLEQMKENYRKAGYL